MLAVLLSVAVAVLTGAYLWIRFYFSYWRRKGVAHIAPDYFFGNLKPAILMRRCAGDHLTDLYKHEKAQNEPYVGIHAFHVPGLLLRDLELIKRVLIKDFNTFSNRFTSANAHGDALGNNNLFLIKNPGWRHLRTKLSPVYSSGKMKQMFYLVDAIGKEIDSYLSEQTLSNKDGASFGLEVKQICTLFTTDVIASVAFGLNANSLKDQENTFRRMGQRFFFFNVRRAVEFVSFFFLPKLVPIINAHFFSREMTAFFKDTINHVMEERLKSGTIRNDLIDSLITIKKNAEESPNEAFEVTNDVLVAQAAIFFAAGFETSSGAMTFGLYELAKQPEVQKRLREEIHQHLRENEGKIMYDSLHSMEYLNMVVMEILRLYPTLPFLDRECALFEGEDGYSLEPFGDFKIPHGMPVFIPILGIQRDPQYFPEPNLFDPERFSPENKSSIVSGSYLPFGSGPHNCIGERFGLMQTKIGLVHFLKNHFVKFCDKTMPEMVLHPRALIIQPEGNVYLDVVRDVFEF